MSNEAEIAKANATNLGAIKLSCSIEPEITRLKGEVERWKGEAELWALRTNDWNQMTNTALAEVERLQSLADMLEVTLQRNNGTTAKLIKDIEFSENRAEAAEARVKELEAINLNYATHEQRLMRKIARREAKIAELLAMVRELVSSIRTIAFESEPMVWRNSFIEGHNLWPYIGKALTKAQGAWYE